MSNYYKEIFKSPPKLVQHFRYDFILEKGTKKDPIKRWNLPDEIFFGHGACPILAGVFLEIFPNFGFNAIKITPKKDYPGNHIYVTNGKYAFDYHGLSLESTLKIEFFKAYKERFPHWEAEVENINYSLLNTKSLNQRKMLGPDQYLHDPKIRGEKYINKLLDFPNAAV